MDPYSIINKYYPEGELRNLLIYHSEQVCRKALESIKNSGYAADIELIKAGALLHDIGIFRCYAPDILCLGTLPYIQHGIEGAKILREEGYEELARFCERHTGAGLTKEDIISQHLPLPPIDLIPESIEEKAVCYADKFFSKSGDFKKEKEPDKVMTSMKRHGDDSLRRFMEMHSLFNPKQN